MTVIAPIFDGLKALADWLGLLDTRRIHNEQRVMDAVRHSLRALHLTKAYVVCRHQGQPKDRQKEESLATAWAEAAAACVFVQPDLARIWNLKAAAWADPGVWDSPDFPRVETSLDAASQHCDRLLQGKGRPQR